MSDKEKVELKEAKEFEEVKQVKELMETKELEEFEDDEDVCIVAEGKSFTAKKRLLMEKCDFFKAMFGGGYKESTQNTITIQIVTAAAFQFILDYFKENSIGMLEFDRVVEVVDATNYLHLDELKKMILERLTSLIRPETCFDIMRLSRECGLSALETKAEAFALHSFEECRRHVSRIRDLKTLHRYLSHENLNARDEYDVFSAGLDWLRHRRPSPNNLTVVLGCVLFKNLSGPSLRNLVRDCGTVADPNETAVVEHLSLVCGGAPLEDVSKRVDAETAEIVRGILSPQRTERRPALRPHVVKSDKVVHGVMEYLPSENRLAEAIAVPDAKWWGLNVVAWRGLNVVTLCGKHKNDMIWNKEINVLDLLTGRWRTLPTFLAEPRRHATALVHEDTVYLMGGFGHYRSILNSVRSYNLRTGEWLSLPDLPERNTFYAACFHRGRLHVCGDGLYALDGDRWRLVVRPQIKCSAILSHKDKMYFGGKWLRKILGGTVEEDKSPEISEIVNTHYNTSGMCSIGDTAYIFSTGEDFEDVIGIETFPLTAEPTEPSSTTSLLWVEKDCDGRFDIVPSCFTLASLEVDGGPVNNCAEQWISPSKPNEASES